MRLSAKILENVHNVNSFEEVEEAVLHEAQANDFYIRLIDLAKHELRYITQASSYSLSAEFDSIDDAAKLVISATQPFADDKSIWKISLTSSQLPKSGDFILALTEDGITKKFKVRQSVSVELLDDSSC